MRRALVFFVALPLAAELLKVEQRYGGIECASCVDAIARGVKRLRGVESAEVDTKANVVKIALATGNRVTLAAIRDAVKATGFTPGEAAIEAHARLEKRRVVIGDEIFETAAPDVLEGDAAIAGEVAAAAPGQPTRIKLRRAHARRPLGQ
jgi:copper chaperone CopZ